MNEIKCKSHSFVRTPLTNGMAQRSPSILSATADKSRRAANNNRRNSEYQERGPLQTRIVLIWLLVIDFILPGTILRLAIVDSIRRQSPRSETIAQRDTQCVKANIAKLWHWQKVRTHNFVYCERELVAPHFVAILTLFKRSTSSESTRMTDAKATKSSTKDVDQSQLAAVALDDFNRWMSLWAVGVRMTSDK